MRGASAPSLQTPLRRGRLYYNGRDLFPLNGHTPAHRGWRENAPGVENHEGNAGWRLGVLDVVIDYDVRKDLDGSQLIEFQFRYPELNPSVRSGGGGFHYYCSLVESIRLRGGIPSLKAFDVKKYGGYVLIAGCSHRNGGTYEWLDGGFDQEIPPDLLEEITKPEGVVSPNADLSPEGLAGILANIDATDCREYDEWFALCAASHQTTGGSPEGLAVFLEWCRTDPKYVGDTRRICAIWDGMTVHPEGVAAHRKGTLWHAIAKTKARQRKAVDSDFDSGVEADDNDFDSGVASAAIMANATGEGVPDVGRSIAREALSQWPEGHLCYSDEEVFWEYGGTHWVPLSPVAVERDVLKSAEAFKQRTGLKGTKLPKLTTLTSDALRLLRLYAESSAGLGKARMAPEPFLNLANGELWLVDGKAELRPHNRLSFATATQSWAYDATATCPLFDRVLHEILQDPEIERHFLELAGYTLAANKDFPVFVLLQGGGSNGKSLLLELLVHLAGDEALTLKSLSDLDSEHALSELPGKRIVVDDDLARNYLLPDGLIKKLAGPTMIQANPKYERLFQFRNRATLWIGTNPWPKIGETGHAIERRAHVIKFKRRFSAKEADENLLPKLLKERAGIFNRMAGAYLRLLARGHFDTPDVVRGYLREWLDKSSAINIFLTSRCTEGAGETSVEALWCAYGEWCVQVERSKRTYTRSGFKAALAERGLLDGEMVAVRLEAKIK